MEPILHVLMYRYLYSAKLLSDLASDPMGWIGVLLTFWLFSKWEIVRGGRADVLKTLHAFGDPALLSILRTTKRRHHPFLVFEKLVG